MSQEEKNKTRSLAEVKEYLERRIGDLEKELELLRKLVDLVNEELAERSFKKPSLPQELKEPVKEPAAKVGVAAPVYEEAKTRVLRSRTGEVLATVLVSPNELRVRISPDIGVTMDVKPFSSFLVKKVLDAMSRMDQERVKKGLIPPGQELTYNIIQEDGKVKELVVRNFREEYRLREIVNAIRWTLETIVEKQSSQQ